jgi:hypothetical protein
LDVLQGETVKIPYHKTFVPDCGYCKDLMVPCGMVEEVEKYQRTSDRHSSDPNDRQFDKRLVKRLRGKIRV